MRANKAIYCLSSKNLETSRHLFQPPLYHNGVSWDEDFINSATNSSSLSWEPAAFTSFCSFGYLAGDLSPVEEVRRRPWMSSLEDTNVLLSDIPAHGRRWLEPTEIADQLKSLLTTEAKRVCEGVENVYILLSGGLDSRIIAGTIAGLVASGTMKRPPTAVTWGSENSRDVVYARFISEMLGFPWIHLTLGKEDLLRNVQLMGEQNGCATSPNHLHRMDWFSQFSNDVLVLAGSYGDSVGRSEFSGRIVLELDYLRPKNLFGLMGDSAFACGVERLEKELEAIRQRGEKRPKYAVCELEQQGNYMRGMIAHAMSILGRSCHLYQMFTAPEVYSFMWSIHPAARTDQVYTELLTQIDSRLARVPWARTNRSLAPRPIVRDTNATRSYHSYQDWIAGPLWDELTALADPGWLDGTGLFDGEQVNKFIANLSSGKLWRYGIKPHEALTWLASIRCLSTKLEENHKRVHSCPPQFEPVGKPPFVTDDRTSLRRQLSRLPIVQRTASRLRRSALRKVALRTYPISKTLSKD